MRTVSVEVGAKPDIITLSGHNLAQPHEHTRSGCRRDDFGGPCWCPTSAAGKMALGSGAPGAGICLHPTWASRSRSARRTTEPTIWVHQPAARKRPVSLTCSRSTRCPGSGASLVRHSLYIVEESAVIGIDTPVRLALNHASRRPTGLPAAAHAQCGANPARDVPGVRGLGRPHMVPDPRRVLSALAATAPPPSAELSQDGPNIARASRLPGTDRLGLPPTSGSNQTQESLRSVSRELLNLWFFWSVRPIVKESSV